MPASVNTNDVTGHRSQSRALDKVQECAQGCDESERAEEQACKAKAHTDAPTDMRHCQIMHSLYVSVDATM